MTEFAKRVMDLLKEKGLTQKELANMANIAESSLSRYLSGDLEPRIDVVNNIAIALGVSSGYLIGNSEEHRNKENSYHETYRILARNKNTLTNEEKAKLIDLLFGSNR